MDNPFCCFKVVVYIHSKGSFHDSPQNARLRSYATAGAVSEECRQMPAECNICSSRMTPIPYLGLSLGRRFSVSVVSQHHLVFIYFNYIKIYFDNMYARKNCHVCVVK